MTTLNTPSLATLYDEVHEKMQRRLIRLPVAVIGPRSASPKQLEVAELLGSRLAEFGFIVLTGGKGGVMEAAARGAVLKGGITIGILPDYDWTNANSSICIPIATGLGSARNAVIARACFALIAVGGEYGTQTEMAFGMHFGRRVIALENAPDVAGALRYDTVDEALAEVSRAYLELGPDDNNLATADPDDGAQ